MGYQRAGRISQSNMNYNFATVIAAADAAVAFTAASAVAVGHMPKS